MKPDLSRVPPQNLEAEEAVLGAVLISNNAIHRIRQIVRHDDFYLASNGKIFRAMAQLIDQGKNVDIITLSGHLKDCGDLEQAGGISRLNEIADTVPTAANVEHHARIVQSKAQLRRLLEVSRNMQERIYSEQDPVVVAAHVSRALCDLMQNGGEGGFVDLSTAVLESEKWIQKVFEKGDRMTGISTGFRDIDLMVGGIEPGELWIPAGRPGMGKSAFGVDLAVNGARTGHATCVVSLEMPNRKISQRLLSAATGIENRNLRRGLISDAGFQSISRESARLAQLPVWLMDKSRDWDVIKSQIRGLKVREPILSLVVIDYVGLITADTGRREYNRNLELGKISSDAKRLAVELDVGLVLISQLSRRVEERADKRPMLSDLRESGNLEQDADVVCFLYRDEYYNPDTRTPGMAELNIAKNRDGKGGKINLRFNSETVSFGNWL